MKTKCFHKSADTKMVNVREAFSIMSDTGIRSETDRFVTNSDARLEKRMRTDKDTCNNHLGCLSYQKETDIFNRFLKSRRVRT